MPASPVRDSTPPHRTEPSRRPARPPPARSALSFLLRCPWPTAFLTSAIDVVRHRDVVEGLGHLRRPCRSNRRRTSAPRCDAATSAGFLYIRMKVAAVIGQDFVAGLVGQDQVEAGRVGPVGVGGGGLERLDRRRDGLAGLVDHVGVGQLVLLGVGVFDIADRALGAGDIVGDAVVALGADADRPFDRGRLADLGLPVRRDLRRDSW